MKVEKFLAFDTETINRPGGGQACLLARECSAGVMFRKFPRVFGHYFDFLAPSRPARSYVAWNMDFDARAGVHPNFLPWKVCESLGLYGHVKHGAYSFRYTPDKFLEVRHRDKRSFIIFDLAQFFGMSLADFARKHCPDLLKEDLPEKWYGEMDFALRDKREGKILSYAKRDVKIVARARSLLLDSLEVLGMKPTRLSSCASLARLRYGKILARLRAPDYINARFERGFFGGRIECATLGKVEDVSLFDINSAYPAEISKLVDPTQGVHLESSLGSWRFRGLSDYGLYSLEVFVPLNWRFGPFAVRERGKVFYPVGHVRTIVGAQGLALIRKLKLPYKVRYAYEIFDCPRDVLFPDMNEMYLGRKGSPASLAIKLTINSLYGLMAESTNYLLESLQGERVISGRWHETKRVYGRLTNFVLASHITESVRLKVWDAARAHGAHFIATDSILVSRGRGPKTGAGLGEWGLKGHYKSGAILGCGRYALNGEKPLYHLRGFPVKKEIFERLKKCRTARARIPILETPSLRQWALNPFIGDLNVLTPSSKYLEVADDKRYWPEKHPLISDYFSATIFSKPWIVGRPDHLIKGEEAHASPRPRTLR